MAFFWINLGHFALTHEFEICYVVDNEMRLKL